MFQLQIKLVGSNLCVGNPWVSGQDFDTAAAAWEGMLVARHRGFICKVIRMKGAVVQHAPLSVADISVH